MSRASASSVAALIVLCAVVAACKEAQPSTPPPAHAAAELVAMTGSAVLIGAGDIGVCGTLGDELAAQLVDSVVKADSAANVETAVFTLGDNAYPSGLDRDFVRCFGSSWGDPKKRIMKVIRPAIGNHDYQSQRGAAYYRYFGSRAGGMFKGYYSFDIGDWHAIVLNSEIVTDGTLNERVAQETWLRKDLEDNRKLCTVAYFHRPLFSSGVHGPSPELRGLWEILSAGGVDLALTGHDHNYERFLPQTPAGIVDTVTGIPEYVVGTGGGPLTAIRTVFSANSAMRIAGRWGVLILTLGPTEYRTSFLDIDGQFWDPAGGKCH